MFCDVVLLSGAVFASGSPQGVLTEGLLREVFRIEADVSESPCHGRPHIHRMSG
jgi:iron complex transport system ATP-binding protein